MSLEEAVTLIVQRAEDDPELAVALRTVLSGMLERLPKPATEPLPIPEPVPASSPAVEEAVAQPLGAFGDTEPNLTQWPDLVVVAARLALKTKAARWVAKYGYTEQPEALNERHALLTEARAKGFYLWLLDRNRVDPTETEALRELADLFELTTRCLGFWRDAGGTPEEGAADRLLAEMQAALRDQALELAGYADDDQFALYRTLRLSAQVSRTYLPQLSLSYRSQNVPTLGAELEALQGARKAREDAEANLEHARGKVERYAQSVVQNPGYLGRWRKLEGALAELYDLGERLPYLKALTDLELPDDLPLITQALATTNAPADQVGIDMQAAADVNSPEVEHVRALVTGRVMLIVGGDYRPEAVARLEAAFQCTVRWQETAPHTSLNILEPAVTDEVAVVLLLIRWSSHMYQISSGLPEISILPR